MVGAVIGVAAAGVPAVGLLVVGGSVDRPWIEILAVLVGFAGQFLAGFVAGNTARRNYALHGGLAAAGGFLALSSIALASDVDPGLTSLISSVVVALVLGSAGGVLAGAMTDEG